MYSTFRERGLCVIPLHNGIPRVPWSQYFYELPTAEVVSSWKGKEYGLVCGQSSNVIGLDIDTDDPIGDVIYALAGKSPVRKRGSKGFTAFYRYNKDPSCVWKEEGATSPVAELLSDKRITTIPPSPHRKTGIPYEWLEEPLVDASRLPVISDDFFRKMDALFPPKKIHYPSYHHVEHDDISLSEVQEMLHYVSSDCSREEWISVGMALRDEFGDAACTLYHQWSAKTPSRYNHAQCQAAWRSFTGSGVTIGTIVYLAKQGGWSPAGAAGGSPVEVKAEIKNEVKAICRKENTDFSEQCLKAPGLLGDMVQFTVETAIYPHPVLSLASCLATLGFVMGRSHEGFKGMRTNIYTVGIAPSGSGKDHPLKVGKRMLKAAELGKHINGQPSSGASFPSMLEDCGGQAIIYTDEIGRVLAQINGEKAASYERGIAKELIELYTSSSDSYYGKSYANRKENKPIVIDEPCMCLYGTTVKENLVDSLVGRDALDGFLARILFFEAPERAQRQKDIFDANNDKVPNYITENLKRLFKRDHTMYGEVPHKVEFNADAKAMFIDYWDAKDALQDEDPACSPIYARMTEHVVKLSMMAATSNFLKGQYIIEGSHFEWAKSVVDYSIGLMIQTVKNEIADTPRLKLNKRIMKLINKHDTLTHRQIMHGVHNVNAEDINKSLSDLHERGSIEISRGPRGGKVYTAS